MILKNKYPAASLFIALVFFSYLETRSEEKPNVAIQDNVPPGFENLVEEQILFVDVFFNGRNIGTTEISANLDSITFNDPIGLLAKLQNISDIQELQIFFAESFPTNAEKLCYSPNQPAGCGDVDPDPVAVIYNSDLLELDLFISPEYQLIQARETEKYLPAAEEKLSAILSLDAIASDNSGSSTSIDFSSRIQASFGAANLNTNIDYNSRNNSYRLNEANLTQLFNDHALTIGSHVFESGSLLNNIDILGVTLKSSTLTRVDLASAFSSELAVYLPRRSQVRVKVDDRIYLADRYPAGNQALDTRSLPHGTYEVEIIIDDPQTGERTEKRLFTKSTEIPMRGKGAFGFSAGLPLIYDSDTSLPTRSSTLLGGLSYSRRLTDQSSWRIALSGLESTLFAEADFQYLGKNLSLIASVNRGSQGSEGGALRLNYSGSYLNTSFNYQRMRASNTAFEDEYLNDAISNSFDQLGVSLNKSFSGVSLTSAFNLRRSLNSSSQERVVRQFSSTIRSEIFRSGNVRSNIQLRMQANEDEQSARIEFTFSDVTPDYSTRGLVSQNVTSQNDSYDSNISHQRKIEFDSGLTMNNNFFAGIEDIGKTVGFDTEMQNKYVELELDNQWRQDDSVTTRRDSTVRLSSHIGIDRHGLAVGGSNSGLSGVIVSIDGLSNTDQFEINVNGVSKGNIDAGKTQFIGLPSLQNYTVQLLSTKSLVNTLDQDTFNFALYPGMVSRVSTKSTRKILFVTTLIDQQGNVLKNGMIEIESEQYKFGDEGFIQIDATPGETYKVKRTNQDDCYFQIPEVEITEQILIMETPLACEEPE